MQSFNALDPIHNGRKLRHFLGCHRTGSQDFLRGDWVELKAGVHVKAVLTSLKTAL